MHQILKDSYAYYSVWGWRGEPKPLIEFFGGINAVTCPVDDPSPLTRINDSTPIPEKRIDFFKEIQPEFYLQNGNITLFQAGKIKTYGQGCDGPLEKVVRDFMLEGNAVNIIDEKAGLEHFGRRIPDRMDFVLGVLDCTLESTSIARRINQFCEKGGIKDFGLILNKIESEEMESMLIENLAGLKEKVIGSILYDQELVKTGLLGKALGECKALEEVEHIVEGLEKVISTEEEIH